SDRTVVFALALVGIAAAVIGNGIFGIEPDRLVEISDRTVVLTLAVVGIAAILIGNGVFGVSLNETAAGRNLGIACPVPARVIVVSSGRRGRNAERRQGGGHTQNNAIHMVLPQFAS